MRSSSHPCHRSGESDHSETVNTQCNRGDCQKILYVVGIGPGSLDHLTRRAVEVLQTVDAVAGYTTYIDLIRPLIEDKHIISTPMTKEVERVQAAIDTVQNGHSCAIVSSGDPGIYAMAGLAFEICKENRLRCYSRRTPKSWRHGIGSHGSARTKPSCTC